jgi:hypothetical protein
VSYDEYTTRLVDTDTRLALGVRPYVRQSPATEVIALTETVWGAAAEPAIGYVPKHLRTTVMTLEQMAAVKAPPRPVPTVVASAPVIVTEAAVRKISKIAMLRANVRGLLPW